MLAPLAINIDAWVWREVVRADSAEAGVGGGQVYGSANISGELS